MNTLAYSALEPVVQERLRDAARVANGPAERGRTVPQSGRECKSASPLWQNAAHDAHGYRILSRPGSLPARTQADQAGVSIKQEVDGLLKQTQILDNKILNLERSLERHQGK
jgi:hypothetical protein